MKKSQLRQIIKEEISKVLDEGAFDYLQLPRFKNNPGVSPSGNNVEGKFEIRGKDINNDGNLFYSLYLDGKQIGPNVIKNGGVTSGKDFEETLRKFIK